ncbi:MAG: HAD-IB family hydrolase [Actinomycetota bacterium]|nr:HAD-IB family hydrolase [Actinomycetota bacterium]
MAPETRGAFFDLDRTLIPGSSLFLLARGLYERDMFRVRDILRFGWGQMLFRLQGERTKNMTKSRQSTLDFVAGRRRQDIVDWGREIAEERIIPRVYQDIATVIRSHSERGDKTFLVTAAPVELAEVVAAELDMSGAVATEAEVDDRGFYTGRLVGPVIHGPEKAKAVAEIAAQHGIELAESAAYSDSINDLPLLESVGYPHAVNPEHELRRVALTRGWPIHELRTRRRALLIGVPAGIGGAGLFGSGIALGAYLERRRAAASPVEKVKHATRRLRL